MAKANSQVLLQKYKMIEIRQPIALKDPSLWITLAKAQVAYGHGLKDMFLTEENCFGFHRNTLADKVEEHTSENENTAIPSGIYSGWALVHALLAVPLLLSPVTQTAKLKISVFSLPVPCVPPHCREVYTMHVARSPPRPPGTSQHPWPTSSPPLSHSCLLALPQSWKHLLFLPSSLPSFLLLESNWLSFPFPLLACFIYLFSFFKFQEQKTNL